MNRQSLLIIAIIAGGSVLSGLAYGVTNGTIVVGDLTITGTCSGCGTENDYTSYNTVFYNNTNSVDAAFIDDFHISNTGAATIATASHSYVISSSGTVIGKGTNYNFGTPLQSGQSVTGIYKAYIIANGTGSIMVVKNDSVLQQIHPNVSQFGINLSGEALSVSPNGKYIGLVGPDSGGTTTRLVIFQGS